MDHSFNIEVAKRLGIAPAVILNNLYWWVEKNKTNDKNFHDGYYWTYNRRKAFVEQFPYLTERQIEYALRKLIDEGYIITGNYNKSTYDRTLWYSITKEGYSILQNCGMEITKLLNGNNKIVTPIPDINKDIKTNNTLPTVEGQVPIKTSYRDVFERPENKLIMLALVKFIRSLSGKSYNPKVSTVEKFANNLREYSQNNPELAMMIVDQSINKGWKAIYPLKDKYKADAVSKNFTGENAKDADGNDIVW